MTAPRPDCNHPLHEHDFPDWWQYGQGDEEADRRLDSGWLNQRCPDCGYGGWIPPAGTTTDDTTRRPTTPPKRVHEATDLLGKLFDSIDAATRRPGEPSLRSAAAAQARQAREQLDAAESGADAPEDPS